MKILEFGPTLFRLPDDFVGGVPEALRALADAYDEGFERTDSQKRRGRPTKLSAVYDEFRVTERLPKFFKAVEEGAKFDGLLLLMETDDGGKTLEAKDDGWE